MRQLNVVWKGRGLLLLQDVSKKTTITGCLSWRGLLLQDAFLSMVGAADSQLKGMALQRQKVLTTLNLEIVKHTHTCTETKG